MEVSIRVPVKNLNGASLVMQRFSPITGEAQVALSQIKEIGASRREARGSRGMQYLPDFLRLENLLAIGYSRGGNSAVACFLSCSFFFVCLHAKE